MDYQAAICQNTNKKQLSFSELATIIAGLAGDEQSDGKMKINGDKLDTVLRSILGENGTTAAWFHFNNPEVQAKLNWHYEVNEGNGYYTTK
jgi:hypothetical protein